jgi:hypothetical protein
MARPHAVAEEESFLFLKYTSTYIPTPHSGVWIATSGDTLCGWWLFNCIFNTGQRLLLSPVHFQLSVPHNVFIYLFIYIDVDNMVIIHKYSLAKFGFKQDVKVKKTLGILHICG